MGRVTRSLRRRARVAVAKTSELLRTGARPLAAVHDLFRADLRRSRRAYWARRWRLTAVVAVYAAIAVCAGVLVHWVVTIVMLAPFVIEATRLAWRARPGWGTSAGLPPGSVGVGTGSIMRFDSFAEAARRYGPVFKTNYFRDPMVCIADLETGTEFLRANADDLGYRPNFFNANIPGGAIRWADEPRHTELRRLFGRAMSARTVAEWVPVFDDRLHEMLADVASRASGAHPREFLRDGARRVCTAFLFGVFPTDPEFAEVDERLRVLDICRPYPAPREEAEAHLERLAAMIRARLAEPVAGRPVSVAGALVHEHPDALDDVGVMRNLVYLGLGPRDDLAGLLTWVCWYLARNPRWLAEVRRVPEGDDLPERIVSETLRLDQSEYLNRFPLRDLEVAGFRVPAGWKVRVCIREIHRDATHFPDPTRFDPDRFLGGRPSRDIYAPLGVDHHSCIGEPLGRCVAQRLVRALADGYDLEVLDDGPRGLSQNTHWAPSERFRIQLVEVATR